MQDTKVQARVGDISDIDFQTLFRAAYITFYDPTVSRVSSPSAVDEEVFKKLLGHEIHLAKKNSMQQENAIFIHSIECIVVDLDIICTKHSVDMRVSNTNHEKNYCTGEEA